MRTSRIKIADYWIGEDEPFIVAEAGINHNGEIKKALEMVQVAKAAGAHAIKFQTYKADEIVASPSQLYTYKSQGKTVTEPMLDMFKRYEFSREQWLSIKKKCLETGIIFLSTPQNRSDLDLLLELGVAAIKVGSDDFTNIPLLKDYATTGLPLLLSMGMADLTEVKESLAAVGAMKKYPTVLLACTSEYPTPPEDANLLRLKTLSQMFPDILLGFSDHTRGVTASCLAVALGACIFEKHFTLDNNLPGPDHWFSENPSELKEWIRSIQLSYTMLGSSVVQPTEQEKINRNEFRRVIVASKKIQKGQSYTDDNLVAKRVAGGKGLSAKLIPNILGKKAPKDYEKNESVEI